jgi:hypothetical protein
VPVPGGYRSTQAASLRNRAQHEASSWGCQTDSEVCPNLVITQACGMAVTPSPADDKTPGPGATDHRRDSEAPSESESQVWCRYRRRRRHVTRSTRAHRRAVLYPGGPVRPSCCRAPGGPAPGGPGVTSPGEHQPVTVYAAATVYYRDGGSRALAPHGSESASNAGVTLRLQLFRVPPAASCRQSLSQWPHWQLASDSEPAAVTNRSPGAARAVAGIHSDQLELEQSP